MKKYIFIAILALMFNTGFAQDPWEIPAAVGVPKSLLLAFQCE